MLKKIVLVLTGILLLNLTWAQEEIKPIESFSVKCGNLLLRFDGKKFDNINLIEFGGKIFGIDNAGAHYGTVVFFDGATGFIGSGHKETGSTEKLLLVTLDIDGKLQNIENNKIYSGKNGFFAKQFMLKDILCNYRVDFFENYIDEEIELSSEVDQKIKYLYLFMHPWSTDFDRMISLNKNGKIFTYDFVGDEKFPQRDKLQYAAFYNSKNGNLAISVADSIQNQKDWPLRFVWDRKGYRKDYMVTFYNETMVKQSKNKFGMKTFFFVDVPADSWQNFVAEWVKKEQ